MFNYVDFYRYHDKTEDVFLEDGHLLYASAEPFGWAHHLACVTYYQDSNGALTRGETVGADVGYLDCLEPAPEATVFKVIEAEAAFTEYVEGVCA